MYIANQCSGEDNIHVIQRPRKRPKVILVLIDCLATADHSQIDKKEMAEQCLTLVENILPVIDITEIGKYYLPAMAKLAKFFNYYTMLESIAQIAEDPLLAYQCCQYIYNQGANLDGTLMAQCVCDVFSSTEKHKFVTKCALSCIKQSLWWKDTSYSPGILHEVLAYPWEE